MANETQHEALMTMAVNSNKDTVHIDDVKSGLQSDAFCVVCNSTLIAKKGNINAHHFAHTNGTECKYWRETFIHLAVKKYLAEAKEILLPGYFVGRELIQRQRVFKFADCIVENRLGNIVPDICLVADNGVKLIVEVAVTHFCDETKIQKIKELNVSCIEISFAKFRYCDSIKDSDIKTHIEGVSAVWVFNRKLTPIHDKAMDADNKLSTLNLELTKLNEIINKWQYTEGRYDDEWTRAVRVLANGDLDRWESVDCPIGRSKCNRCQYKSWLDKSGKDYWYVSCAYSENNDYLNFVADTTKEKQAIIDKREYVLKCIK